MGGGLIPHPLVFRGVKNMYCSSVSGGEGGNNDSLLGIEILEIIYQ